jgi:hypothetical protein
LCSGKGGDLHKWIYNNVSNVDGYDISDKNIAECKKRVIQMQTQNKYNFYKLDLTKEDSYEIIYKNNPKGYDCISCQFGIHYFFESQNTVDNILKILDNCLNNNGYFMITFLDNTKLDELFQTSKNLHYSENENEIVYLLERDISLKDSLYGNRLKVALNGNNILGEGSDEWIINFQTFKKLMQSNGYECVETELFENIYDSKSIGYELLKCERDISFLNRYCVFRKKSETNEETNQETNQERNEELNTLPSLDSSRQGIELLNQKIDIITNIKTEFNFNTIDLHQKNISVAKITDLYNVIDILNCIQYKYYKNKINNAEIVSFNNITNLFESMNVNYNPVFIQDPLDFTLYKPGKCNLYFTYYKHIIEKKDEKDETEAQEFNNWYIIMYHNKMIFDMKTLGERVQENPQECVQEKPQECVQEKPQECVQENPQECVQENPQECVQDAFKKYEELQGKKVTIKVLKDLLQKLNLKTSGKKEELQERLKEYYEKEYYEK